MDHSLAGRVVLITGSSRGIGASIAEAFAKAGAHPIINYVKTKEKAELFAAYLCETYAVDAVAIKADVTDEAAVSAMIEAIVEEFDTIDIVVNNALYHYTFDPDARKKAWEVEWKDYEQQLHGSLKGTYHVCKYIIPVMKANTNGKIINMTTNLLHRPVVPYHDYNTAKGAVMTYSHNLAADLGMFGITVNCVAPGLVYPTDASRRTKEEVKEGIIRETPLRRIARPEDITGSVLYLASSWANFVTGQTIVVDGGLNMT
ncbi:SDR family oxidoreductase [Salicibibacter halophilus]|uniref:SDR family oxidoreductase n=1 Tax=Salicibibacter halophilus TaxID=2502791 RepID=A0A514LGN0_9BACI|nr:SDR family oxidoreductase [Salicibibacter halophilus]QDI90695.1 SDR family oxidoreductase [Salicibibacter halophilus]